MTGPKPWTFMYQGSRPFPPEIALEDQRSSHNVLNRNDLAQFVVHLELLIKTALFYAGVAYMPRQRQEGSLHV
jgi:hypothetical protein